MHTDVTLSAPHAHDRGTSRPVCVAFMIFLVQGTVRAKTRQVPANQGVCLPVVGTPW